MSFTLIVSIYLTGCIIFPYMLGQFFDVHIENNAADISMMGALIMFWPVVLPVMIFGKIAYVLYRIGADKW